MQIFDFLLKSKNHQIKLAELKSILEDFLLILIILSSFFSSREYSNVFLLLSLINYRKIKKKEGISFNYLVQ